jgi:hypothetical protein
MTLNITTFVISFNITKSCITTFSIWLYCNTQHNEPLHVIMLTVAFSILSVVMLNVVVLNVVVLNVVMLNVIMLNVVAPYLTLCDYKH